MRGKSRITCYMGAVVDKKLSGTKVFIKAVAGHGGVVYPRAGIYLRQGKSPEKTAEVAKGAAVGSNQDGFAFVFGYHSHCALAYASV